jgi:hypothetical protein
MLLFTVWWLQKLGVITRREKTEPILGQYDWWTANVKTREGQY